MIRIFECGAHLEELVLVVGADDADLLPCALVDPGRDDRPDEAEEEGRVDHQDPARPLHVVHLQKKAGTPEMKVRSIGLERLSDPHVYWI